MKRRLQTAPGAPGYVCPAPEPLNPVRVRLLLFQQVGHPVEQPGNILVGRRLGDIAGEEGPEAIQQRKDGSFLIDGILQYGELHPS